MEKSLPKSLFALACIGGMLALSGCGSEPAPAPEKSVGTPAKPDLAAQKAQEQQVIAAANAGSLLPRYSATLAEGFNFAKPGAPDFILEVTGLSGTEPWGRWTDANLGPATLRFRDQLPERFTLRLKVRDYFGLNAQQKVTVRVGAQEQSFVLLGSEDQNADLKFEGVTGADTIVISVPKHSTPSPADPRKVGLGLISLSIQP